MVGPLERPQIAMNHQESRKLADKYDGELVTELGAAFLCANGHLLTYGKVITPPIAPND
jgi:hypothetical protein